MPVIRVDTTTTTTTPAPDERELLLAKLKGEIKGPSTPGGPVIFEIPEGIETVDVFVVWEDWADWRSEDRTCLILDAYKDKPQNIAQAMGVTYEEAMQQQLLPYAVVSTLEQNAKFRGLVCSGNQSESDKLLVEIRNAKRALGGIDLPDGKVELRFPTRAMADQAHAVLFEKKRDLYWSVVYTVARIAENL